MALARSKSRDCPGAQPLDFSPPLGKVEGCRFAALLTTKAIGQFSPIYLLHGGSTGQVQWRDPDPQAAKRTVRNPFLFLLRIDSRCEAIATNGAIEDPYAKRTNRGTVGISLN